MPRSNRDNRELKLGILPPGDFRAQHYMTLKEEFGDRTFSAEAAINVFNRETCRPAASSRVSYLIELGGLIPAE